jgi:hypothetical protein
MIALGTGNSVAFPLHGAVGTNCNSLIMRGSRLHRNAHSCNGIGGQCWRHNQLISYDFSVVAEAGLEPATYGL